MTRFGIVHHRGYGGGQIEFATAAQQHPPSSPPDDHPDDEDDQDLFEITPIYEGDEDTDDASASTGSLTDESDGDASTDSPSHPGMTQGTSSITSSL